MNILIFSWRGPGHPNAGGAEISTHEHAKGWVKAGHTVTLFTSYYHGAKREEVVDGVILIRRGRQIFEVQWEAFKWYVFGKHLKFNLIIDQFHGIPFFIPLYIREKKLAFIHEVAKEVWSLNPWSWPFNLIPAFIGTIFEPLVFKLFYQKIPFMTVSESTKEDLIKWGIPKENIFIVHNGLETLKIKSRFSKEKNNTLIFLGTLTKDKGIEEALKTFSILDNTENYFQFWVVGKGDKPYLEKLRLQTIKLNINDKVKFWGFVSKEKKFELLSKAHILINPSIREGWGLVVIEAAAVGTPTVAFDVPGLRDSVVDGKTGIIDRNNSVNSIADEIIDLLEDSSRYRKMQEEALKWSEKFSWKEAVIKSLDLINKIVKNNNY